MRTWTIWPVNNDHRSTNNTNLASVSVSISRQWMFPFEQASPLRCQKQKHLAYINVSGTPVLLMFIQSIHATSPHSQTWRGMEEFRMNRFHSTILGYDLKSCDFVWIDYKCLSHLCRCNYTNAAAMKPTLVAFVPATVHITSVRLSADGTMRTP